MDNILQPYGIDIGLHLPKVYVTSETNHSWVCLLNLTVSSYTLRWSLYTTTNFVSTKLDSDLPYNSTNVVEIGIILSFCNLYTNSGSIKFSLTLSKSEFELLHIWDIS